MLFLADICLNLSLTFSFVIHCIYKYTQNTCITKNKFFKFKNIFSKFSQNLYYEIWKTHKICFLALII